MNGSVANLELARASLQTHRLSLFLPISVVFSFPAVALSRTELHRQRETLSCNGTNKSDYDLFFIVRTPIVVDGGQES